MKLNFTSAATAFLLSSFFLITSSKEIKAQSHCTPTYSLGCSAADNSISNFTLTGENGTSINNSTGCTAGSFGFGGGYADYTSVPAAVLIPGESYQGSVSTASALPAVEKVRIWIDWDNDGTFDQGDEIAVIDGIDLLTGTSTFSFTVPATATSGDRRLRVRLASGVSASSISPCGSIDVGEAEDYMITVDACTEPTINGILSEEYEPGSFSFAADNPEDVDTYHWDFGDGNTSDDAVVNHTYTSSGTYTITLTVTNDCETNTSTISITTSVLSLNINKIYNLEFYPNPSSEVLNINSDDATSIQSIVIYNPLAQQVYNANLNGTNNYTVDVSALNSGLYFVHIHLSNGEIVQRKLEIVK